MSHLNSLLMLCLGSDESGGYQPVGFEERLQSVCSDASQEEQAIIERLLIEDWAPDWKNASLSEEAQRFAEVLVHKYPDLEPVVARALANRWSYGWR